MSLMNRLNEDMKQSMKEKDKLRLSVIRMIKAALQNEMIQSKSQRLSEDEELTVLSKELKQRKDSLIEFKAADRRDLYEKLEEEITIVESYLPKQLDDNEIDEIVKSTIQETGATSLKDFGKVMGKVMPKVKGVADGNKIQHSVKTHLS